MLLRLYSVWKEKGCFESHFIEPPTVWKGFASFESKGESLCLLVNFEVGFHELPQKTRTENNNFMCLHF